MAMHRIWRMRLAVAVAALGVVPAVSGCVVISSSSSLEQIDVIGDKPIELGMCASGSPGCPLGRSGAPAVTGSGQVLFGVLVSGNTRLPATLASSITLGDSPSYAAELQRLSPAPPGKAWRGFISPTINYDTSSTFQTFTVRLLFQLQRGADGSPFSGPFETSYVVGGRMVTAAAPASRPVSCGPSLTALYDEDPSPTSDVWNVCSDSDGSSLSTVRDLGILRGASATAPQGGLANMPFTVRYAGPPTSQVTFRLSASSSLPGALFAVTPATIVPLPGVANTTAQVGIGVPASARPGPYEVTLTALVNGQIRTSVGTLRVTAAPGAAAAGGAAARLKLTTILPHRLSARVARRRGIVLLIGATKAGPARVQLFQGRAKKPKASKRVRLRVPGPVKVVLKSAKLRKGPYRVVIRGDGRNFVRRGVLVK
jgi:hypothetical protein